MGVGGGVGVRSYASSGNLVYSVLRLLPGKGRVMYTNIVIQ